MRHSFDKGHERKFLVVIDETPEFKKALYFAARVAFRTGGTLAMLQVAEKPEVSSWMPIQMPQLESVNQLTEERIDELRKWLHDKGIDKLRIEAISLSGKVVQEITRAVERDEDIAVLVLGASGGGGGPGPILTALTAGNRAGDFPIPIYIVPGSLSYDEIAALA